MTRVSNLFSDLNLARRLERAEGQGNAKFVEARARVYPDIGAEWIEVAGAYAMFDGADSPITQTFGLGLFDRISASEMEIIEQFFQDRGAPVFHEVSPLAEPSLLNLLNERRYRPIELSSVMYRRIGQDAELVHSPDDRLHVRPIGPDEGEIWARTTARGWNEYPELGDYLLELAPVSTQREDAVSFLVELEGQPIAAGAMSIFGGVGLLAGACTVPEARRQGAQLALLDYRLRYAAEKGCDIAMICTQPGSASQRNAERHGFRIAYTRIKWQLKESAMD